MTIKLLIGVATAESARSAMFYDYLNFLKKPEGTIRAAFHTNSGAYNRNLIIEEALDNKCTHILFLDDDMAFGPECLLQLLKHDKDIISGLYLNRVYPHEPVIFDNVSKEDGIIRHTLFNDEKGLIEVSACGFGFLLVNTDVFLHLEKPFVRTGEIVEDRRLEDISFCVRAREKRFRIFCDLDTCIGHIGQMIVWPNYVEGAWHTGIDTFGTKIKNIPQVTLDMLVKK